MGHVAGIEGLAPAWQRAAVLISDGRVVAVPTDTVYGLVCDPRSTGAVERIRVIKARPPEMELNLLGACAEDLLPFVTFSARARRLADAFWPGAVALVLAAVHPRRVLAVPVAGDTLMVRVPDHQRLRRLLTHTGPVASTSANRHGAAPAATAGEVIAQLDGAVAMVVDGGHVAGRASTIIDCTTTPPRVLRQGPLAERELAPFIDA